MIQNDDSFYAAIGDAIVAVLPGDFIKAWLQVEMMEDVWSLGLFHLKSKGRFGYVGDDLDAVETAMLRLRQAFQASGRPAFTTATFVLAADGQMQLALGYEDVSDLGLSADRRSDWIKANLGSNAGIDWE